MRLALLVAVVGACTPDLVDDTSLVTGPRVLAIAADPPEAAPGATVAFRALAVDTDGPRSDPSLAWSLCTARKPIAEPGPIAPECLVAGDASLVAFGTGDQATAPLPSTGCRLFGPDRPDPTPDQPAGRPVDPDATGGFYQPVTLRAPDDSLALASERIRCGLPSATSTQAAEFAQTYRDNISPAITNATLAGTPLTPLEIDPSATANVSSGALTVHWDAAETYVWFDPDARALTARREAIRIAWFATAGTFASTHTGVTEASADTTLSTNTWTAPPGDAHLWIVVRDSRGGTTWASYHVVVH